MKKHIFLGAAMLLLMATGCSNDENNNGTEPLQKVQFSFTNEDFGEDEALTRATSATEKPQTIDLGDCEAEISVENEPAVKTRGTLTNANGHYTIRAYQGGTLKGEVKGTFSGGAFTPDAGAASNFNLDPGTYDFVAFNDDVITSGTGLTVARDKAETARMGFATQVITATPQKQQVMFTMKHVGARLRMQFLCKKDMPNAITSVLEAADANGIPVSVAYNPTTKAYTATNGTMASESSNSPASTETKYSASNYGQNYSYTSTCTDYHYFLPATEGSNLKLTLSAGTIFWKPLTGTIPQLNATLSMQSNKSYLVKIKLKPDYTYLMSDGTTGKFKDTTFGGGTKTPIAVVVKENNGTAQSGIAVALHNANGGNTCTWGPTDRPGNNAYVNYAPSSTDSGYDLTWGSALSYGGIIKGNNTSFPAFYHTGHYAPGVSVTGSNISKWYLPAGGDFDSFSRNLEWGGGSTGNLGEWSTGYGNLMDQAFTRVGGTAMISPSLSYSIATEGENRHGYYTETHFRYILDKGMYCSYTTKSDPLLVRPFVRY